MRSATLPGLGLFFALNMPLVGFSIWFFLTKGGKDDSGTQMLWLLLATASFVVVLQYPILLAARNWLLKIAVFYGSMLAFLLLGEYLTCMWTCGWTLESAAKVLPLALIFAWVGTCARHVRLPHHRGGQLAVPQMGVRRAMSCVAEIEWVFYLNTFY
jgi:hypothetical protein